MAFKLREMLGNWGRTERNKINDNWKDIERNYGKVLDDSDKAVQIANTANNKSDNAVETANQANATADYVQSQLDNVTAEGDSSAEVVQARKDFVNLRERLDAENARVTEQLAQKVEKVTGKQLSTNDYSNAEKILVAQIPQKANQAFVDAQFATIVSGAPKGTFSTKAALETAYPTGTTGIFLVLADGHWYYWQSTTSAWTDGGMYQASQASKSSLNVQLITSDVVPNYDQTTKTFSFNSTQYYESILIYGNEHYTIPTGTTVINSTGSSASKLVFNTATKNFHFIGYSTNISADEIVLATIRDRNQFICHITASFDVTINEFASGDTMRNNMLKPVRVLIGGKNYPIVNSAAKTLTFPSNLYDWGIYVGNTVYANAIPTGGLTIDLSSATGTTAWCILFNLSTKTFLLVAWNGIASYAKTHALFATFRIDGGKYYFDMPCHYIMDGKLLGEIPLVNEELIERVEDLEEKTENLVGGVVENRLDVFIKGTAHRGYSTEAPENTLPAYVLAKKKGFSYVECDIDWTSDLVPVLIHDQQIGRTSNGTGNINYMTFETVRTYDFGSWKSPAYTGTKIPSFEEFIILCKKLNLHPYLELKGGINATKAQILVDILKKLGMVNNVTWISFADTYLMSILAVLPTARVGVVGTMTQALIDKAKAMKTEQNEVFVNADSYLLTKPLVESALMDGIPVEVWTVNNTTRVHELAEWGVSGIATDTLNIAEVLSE